MDHPLVCLMSVELTVCNYGSDDFSSETDLRCFVPLSTAGQAGVTRFGHQCDADIFSTSFLLFTLLLNLKLSPLPVPELKLK